jgi:hypothetical protein
LRNKKLARAAEAARREWTQRGKKVSDFEVKNCRDCEAPIIWVKTRKRKNLPLDADEVGPDALPPGKYGPGGFRLRMNPDDPTLDGMPEAQWVKGSEATETGEMLYTSHINTCPEKQDRHEQRDRGSDGSSGAADAGRGDKSGYWGRNKGDDELPF